MAFGTSPARRLVATRTTALLVGLALVAVLLPVDGAAGSQSKSNVVIRPNIGIGPIDLGDSKRTVERRLGKGRRLSALTDMYSYHASGGRIDVFFRVGRGRRVRSSGRAFLIQTRSPIFRLGDITSATPFEEDTAARLANTPWVATDCRMTQNYAFLYRARPGRSTSLWYFPGQNAAIEVRSIGRETTAPDTSCPPLD
jgi:hypothetical protein